MSQNKKKEEKGEPTVALTVASLENVAGAREVFASALGRKGEDQRKAACALLHQHPTEALQILGRGAGNLGLAPLGEHHALDRIIEDLNMGSARTLMMGNLRPQRLVELVQAAGDLDDVSSIYAPMGIVLAAALGSASDDDGRAVAYNSMMGLVPWARKIQDRPDYHRFLRHVIGEEVSLEDAGEGDDEGTAEEGLREGVFTVLHCIVLALILEVNIDALSSLQDRDHEADGDQGDEAENGPAPDGGGVSYDEVAADMPVLDKKPKKRDFAAYQVRFDGVVGGGGRGLPSEILSGMVPIPMEALLDLGIDPEEPNVAQVIKACWEGLREGTISLPDPDDMAATLRQKAEESSTEVPLFNEEAAADEIEL